MCQGYCTIIFPNLLYVFRNWISLLKVLITPKSIVKFIALCCVLLIFAKDFAVVNNDSVYGHDILVPHEHTGYSDELLQEYRLTDVVDYTGTESSDGKIIRYVKVLQRQH